MSDGLANAILQLGGLRNGKLITGTNAGFLAEAVRAGSGGGELEFIAVASTHRATNSGKTANMILELALSARLARAKGSLGITSPVGAHSTRQDGLANTIRSDSRCLEHVFGCTALGQTGTLAIRRFGGGDRFILVISALLQRPALSSVVTNTALEGAFRAGVALSTRSTVVSVSSLTLSARLETGALAIGGASCSLGFVRVPGANHQSRALTIRKSRRRLGFEVASSTFAVGNTNSVGRRRWLGLLVFTRTAISNWMANGV